MKNLFKKVSWEIKPIRIKSYQELQEECKEILQWKQCTNIKCDVDKIMVYDLLETGVSENYKVKDDSTCPLCKGFGLIKSDRL